MAVVSPASSSSSRGFISGFVVASAVTRERVHSCARVSKFLLVVARV